MTEHAFAVRPRDGFFFKDARGWFTSASERGHSLDWPAQSSLRGALRTTVGRLLEASRGGKPFDSEAFDRETKSVTLGATLPLRRRFGERTWSEQHRCFPVPADTLVLRDVDDIRYLQPRAPDRTVCTLGRDDDPLRESLWRVDVPPDKPAPKPRWWTNEDLVAWIDRKPLKKHSPEAVRSLELTRRSDLHVGIEPSALVTGDGMLFTSETMESFSPGDGAPWEWAIGLCATIPPSIDATCIPWTVGGDRRIANADKAPKLFEPPKFSHGAKGVRCLVVTPALFERGWLPDGFSELDGHYRGTLPGIDGALELLAACIDRPLHISGWDMLHNRPKSTRRLVPAGSVYFFRKVDGSDVLANDFTEAWLAAMGRETDDGWGRVIAAPWTFDERGT